MVDILENEMELERATSLYLKIRKLEKADGKYVIIRRHLRNLIMKYEADHWSDEERLTKEKITESDLAESLVQAEDVFYQKRKELIKKKLLLAGLNQNDLARILGHRKGYMSELINGLRPFSKEDLVIINLLFKIELQDLIPPFIDPKRALHIKRTLQSLSENSPLPTP